MHLILLFNVITEEIKSLIRKNFNGNIFLNQKVKLNFLNGCHTGMYQIREANQMIEEFMLAANISVAEKILKHYPLCGLLR